LQARQVQLTGAAAALDLGGGVEQLAARCGLGRILLALEGGRQCLVESGHEASVRGIAHYRQGLDSCYSVEARVGGHGGSRAADGGLGRVEHAA
jgi:hypothetical protein